jgi:5-formyltetrahydrofolate cyclo-ligase
LFSGSSPKSALRKEIKAQRDQTSPEDRALWSRQASARVIATAWFQSARSIALFCPIGSEIDPSPIEAAARAKGLQIVYPRVNGNALVFHESERACFVPGPFGLSEPASADPTVALSNVDLIVVPGLAFDPRTGHRIGYGAGFYDRALGEALHAERARALGIAFSLQLRESVVPAEHDVPLDAIAHEGGLVATSERARRELGTAR